MVNVVVSNWIGVKSEQTAFVDNSTKRGKLWYVSEADSGTWWICYKYGKHHFTYCPFSSKKEAEEALKKLASENNWK